MARAASALGPLALVYALHALAGGHAHQFLFVPVLGVAVASFVYGVRAGVVASAVSVVALAHWVLDGGSVRMSPFEAVRLAGVGTVSLLVAWVTGSLRSAYRRAAAERAAALSAAEQLSLEKTRAERAVEVRDEVLAIVSHDLRSPVTATAVTADLLERRLDREAPALSRYARTIQRRADEMGRLIADLLDAASIEAGRLSIRPCTLPAISLGRRAVERFQPLAEAAGIALELRVEEELPQIECDPDRILQALSNLLGNALKVTPAGGTVAVTIGASADEIRFTVSDTGCGIEAEDVPHLFERFRRGRSVKYEGSGLGLAIVRGIIEAHGGRVRVESAPGQGARFSFALPVTRPAAPARHGG